MLHWVWNPTRHPEEPAPDPAVTTSIDGSAASVKGPRSTVGPYRLLRAVCTGAHRCGGRPHLATRSRKSSMVATGVPHHGT